MPCIKYQSIFLLNFIEISEAVWPQKRNRQTKLFSNFFSLDYFCLNSHSEQTKQQLKKYNNIIYSIFNTSPQLSLFFRNIPPSRADYAQKGRPYTHHIRALLEGDSDIEPIQVELY